MANTEDTAPQDDRRPGRPGHNRGKRYPAEVLTRGEVEKLMAAFNKGATGIRNRALVAVLYRAGLRISEALALKPADVDLEGGSIRVLRGKGSKPRTVGIDEAGLRYVERWLDRRRDLGLNGRTPLFSKLDGTPWAPQNARHALAYAGEKAGIDKRVHPHGLRHSYAAELSQERIPVAMIQKALGHSNLGVTSRYLDHLAPQDVVDAVRQREWLVESDA